MSTLAANNITDAAGTGGPTLANGLTIGTSPLAAPSGSAPSYTCRAWVNFNGTGTVAIRASGNVTSITDNNTGDYTVNFTTAMPDANYSVNGIPNSFGLTNVQCVVNTAGSSSGTVLNNKTTSGVRLIVGLASNGAVTDFVDVNVSIFR